MTEGPTDTNRWPTLIIICLGYLMIEARRDDCRRRVPVGPEDLGSSARLIRLGRDAYLLPSAGSCCSREHASTSHPGRFVSADRRVDLEARPGTNARNDDGKSLVPEPLRDRLGTGGDRSRVEELVEDRDIGGTEAGGYPHDLLVVLDNLVGEERAARRLALRRDRTPSHAPGACGETEGGRGCGRLAA